MLVDKADAFSRDEVTYRAFTPVIGRSSLFLAEGSDWRWQRRAVAPIFRHEMLLSFVPTIAVIAERQVERWRTRPPDVPVETAAAMTRSTFEIIVEAILDGSAHLDAERYLLRCRDFPGPWPRDAFDRDRRIDALLEQLKQLGDLAAGSSRNDDCPLLCYARSVLIQSDL
jgi:cytochrome P450